MADPKGLGIDAKEYTEIFNSMSPKDKAFLGAQMISEALLEMLRKDEVSPAAFALAEITFKSRLATDGGISIADLNEDTATHLKGPFLHIPLAYTKAIAEAFGRYLDAEQTDGTVISVSGGGERKPAHSRRKIMGLIADLELSEAVLECQRIAEFSGAPISDEAAVAQVAHDIVVSEGAMPGSANWNDELRKQERRISDVHRAKKNALKRQFQNRMGDK